MTNCTDFLTRIRQEDLLTNFLCKGILASVPLTQTPPPTFSSFTGRRVHLFSCVKAGVKAQHCSCIASFVMMLFLFGAVTKLQLPRYPGQQLSSDFGPFPLTYGKHSTFRRQKDIQKPKGECGEAEAVFTAHTVAGLSGSLSQQREKQPVPQTRLDLGFLRRRASSVNNSQRNYHSIRDVPSGFC